MEFSVIGSSHVKIDVGLCNLSKNLNVNLKNGNIKGLNFGKSGNNFVRLSKSGAVGFRLRTSAISQIQAVVVSDNKDSKFTQTKNNDKVKLYVGMPLDTVSNCNTITHSRAIAAGLKALKLLGVDGVELPIWWGAVERESMGKYDWSSYLAIVDMVHSLGLKLNVSLCFHASSEAKMQLPQWVSQIGESVPDIYFTDRSGNRYKDCLSLSVDDLPVLGGNTPLDVYRGFCESFKSSFSPFMGSTITGISIGLGPDGELRYPSHHNPSKTKTHTGAGEFQCYDKNMLDKLRSHAETHGNPMWGLGGPHDAPSYDQSPLSDGFFTNGGSWETPYGDFFLSWYSNELIRHGDQILSLAASTFKDVPVALPSKIPLMHSWYKTPSHPTELTAGFYNTANRNGYDAISKIFLKNSCKMVIPGMDLSDQDIPTNLQSSPESLLAQIMLSCRKHGIEVSGQNSLVSGSLGGFDQIKENLLGENARVDQFTYQRMGADFFSPKHFRSFTQFFRGLHQPILSLDDFPVEEKETSDLRSDSKLNLRPV